jgi:Uma2 family endonuclease
MSIEIHSDTIRPATSPRPPDAHDDYDYPDSDGRSMGETPAHFRNLSYVADILDDWFLGDRQVFVAGNMFIYYVPGDRLKHVSPDLFVVRGVPKDKPRRKYLLWEERKGPDLVVEVTSESTREEDVDDKKWLYRDVLRVSEYVLFDPYGEYLQPRLQGFLLQKGDGAPMPMISGRLASEVLALHFEADGQYLRLYDPAAGRWRRTPPEERAFAAETAAKLDQATAQLDQTTAELGQTTAKLDQTMADNARLEQELAELRRRLGTSGNTEQSKT